MKLRMIPALALSGVLVLLGAGVLAYAHSGQGGHGPRGLDGMTEHFQEHVRAVLAEADATPEQTARIQTLVDATAADIKAVQQQHARDFAELHEIFTAPTIDRARIERLRASHIAAMDTVSQLCATRLADAAEVLTPAQRARLGEKMRKRHEQQSGGYPHGG